MNKQHFLSIFKLKAVLATTISLALKKKLKHYTTQPELGRSQYLNVLTAAEYLVVQMGQGTRRKLRPALY